MKTRDNDGVESTETLAAHLTKWHPLEWGPDKPADGDEMGESIHGNMPHDITHTHPETAIVD